MTATSVQPGNSWNAAVAGSERGRRTSTVREGADLGPEFIFIPTPTWPDQLVVVPLFNSSREGAQAAPADKDVLSTALKSGVAHSLESQSTSTPKEDQSLLNTAKLFVAHKNLGLKTIGAAVVAVAGWWLEMTYSGAFLAGTILGWGVHKAMEEIVDSGHFDFRSIFLSVAQQ